MDDLRRPIGYRGPVRRLAGLRQQLTRDALGRMLAVLPAAILVAVVTISFTTSFASWIFSGKLAVAQPAGLACLLIGVLVTGLVTALFSSMPFTQAGPESSLVAIIAPALVPLGVLVAPWAIEANAIFALAMAGVLTGLMLGALGLARIGRMVRYIPFPVIAGFLGATGVYLLIGGGRVATGAITLRELFEGAHPVQLAVALLGGIVILLLLPRLRGSLGLPLLILGGILLHHLVALLAGLDRTAQEATGWLPLLPNRLDLPTPFAPEALAQIDGRAMLRLLADLPMLVLVAALALLLNVSGLETATGRDADFDRDLRVAGGAALATGAAGGLFGAASVTRSLLLFQAGGGNRLAAALAALIAGGLPLLYPAPLGLIPSWVLGALLIYLGLAAVQRWVIESRRQLLLGEWLQVLSVVGIILGFGFLVGMIAGLALACGHFLARYGTASPLRARYDGSAAESGRGRPEADRAALRATGAARLVLHLQGFLFFGTASRLLALVRRALDGPERRTHLLLDFREVVGLDSSATQAFNRLRDIARARGLTLVLTGLTPQLLANLGALASDPAVHRLPTLEGALEWLEDDALARLPPRPPPPGFAERLAALLGPAEAGRLLAELPIETVPPGTVLMRQDEESHDIVILEAGEVLVRVRFPSGHEIALRVGGAGTLLGELGFLLDAKRSATLVAETPCRLRRVSRERLAELERAAPALAIGFHRLMAQLLASRIQDKDRLINGLVRGLRQTAE